MDHHATSTADTVVVVQSEPASFLAESLDLGKLLRDLKRHAKPALEALVAMLGSKDEKIRLTAATKLLEFQVTVAKEMNSDQLQRLVAETRLGSGKKTLVDEQSKKNAPLVDFNNIREVD